MYMLERFIDGREEQGGLLDEELKDAGPFRLGCFDVDSGEEYGSIAAFNAQVQETLGKADEFYGKSAPADVFRVEGRRCSFPCPLQDDALVSPFEMYFDRREKKPARAIIIIPHWNALPGAYSVLAGALHKCGFWPIVMTLPHHDYRSASGGPIANGFLNADVGGTVRAVRQSVCEVRSLVNWLEAQGVESIGLLGASLGSCVAALVAAFEPRIDRCALLLTAGDFAEVVWEGRATRHIRQRFEGRISLPELQRAWSIISPNEFLDHYVRNRTRMLIVSARRDSVVPLRLAEDFAGRLRSAGAQVSWSVLPCGHYTLSMQPFASFMFLRSVMFFRGS